MAHEHGTTFCQFTIFDSGGDTNLEWSSFCTYALKNMKHLLKELWLNTSLVDGGANCVISSWWHTLVHELSTRNVKTMAEVINQWRFTKLALTQAVKGSCDNERGSYGSTNHFVSFWQFVSFYWFSVIKAWDEDLHTNFAHESEMEKEGVIDREVRSYWRLNQTRSFG